MTARDTTPPRPITRDEGRPLRPILVVGHGPVAAAVAREIDSAASAASAGTASPAGADAAEVIVHRADDPAAASRLVAALGGTAAGPEVVVAVGDEHHPDAILSAVVSASGPEDPPPRLLVVTSGATVTGIERAVDAGLLDGVVAVPWAPGELGPRILTWWARLDAGRRRDAEGGPEHAALRHRAPTGIPGVHPRAAELLPSLRGSRRTAVAELVDALEESLGPRPRIELPPGVVLSRRDARLGGLYILLRGEVEVLIPGRPFPEGQNPYRGGPLIGLPGLVGDRTALHTTRTLTDCALVHLSEEQLVTALTRSPRVGTALGVAAVHGLDDRLRHAESQRLTETELAVRLHEERERLADALDALSEARVELMSQASAAAIGQMAAGLFHELNNPLAALEGARDHLLADLETLVARGGDAELVTRALRRARTAKARPTAELRSARRRVRAVLPDAETTRRVVAAGLDDDETLRALSSSSPGTREAVVTAAAIGSAARNLDLAVDHIADLVSSLRSSMRPLDAAYVPTDVATTIDDALRITAHRLPGVQVVRDIAEGLPDVTAHPGQLTQVWINLLTNAADVLTGPQAPPDPRVRIGAGASNGGEVIVTVTDNGPGVPDEISDKIFEPRFTTKSGRIRFGLGLGLGISHRIVLDHDGVIDLDSRPGHTAFRVTLPAADHSEEPLT
ncbi:ATP-binding protein [Dietzia maris]|uniref:ATP-binding protein n=1 Tax=Dietzia maris TaxID=37915 RepID=UPI00223BAE35|nr:ATP-binding protein [Dietzia maris]MCT1435048.1 ATP-binding protein [Dietzia maris]MCT1522603.1 ATP-binding protein [Dietzia maris]